MFYEIKIARNGVADNGKIKRLTELYIVEALSAFEAITKFEKEIAAYYPDHEIEVVKKTRYSEVVHEDLPDASFYHVKLNTLSVDERTGKEKKSPIYILVYADGFDDAKARVDNHIKGWMCDVESATISQNKFVDFFA